MAVYSFQTKIKLSPAECDIQPASEIQKMTLMTPFVMLRFGLRRHLRPIPLKMLEADNLALRQKVVDLALEVQALRDRLS